MKRLRWLGVFFGWMLLVGAASAQSQLELDEQSLKSENVPTDAKGLVEYFIAKSPRELDAKNLESLVRKLRSDVYPVREVAKKELIKAESRALPFLRAALTNTANDLEAKTLATFCIETIESKTQRAPIAAAARVLAARNDPRAADVLFNFLPTLNDPLLEEEVLACVGRLAVKSDKVDPRFVKALSDPLSFRRHTAAYLIGRRGGLEHREQLRELLADKDLMVRRRVAEGLFGKRPFELLAESVAADEALIKTEKIDTTDAALLLFLSKRSPSEEEQKKQRALVKALKSDHFKIRAEAAKKLEDAGIPVIPFLRELESEAATAASTMEQKRRAEAILATIRAKNNPAAPIAAAHLLARPSDKKNTGEIIRTLLAYVPFADDDVVEEEILTCLTMLSLREPAIEPDLIKALSDKNPARRAAAAFVLGHVGTKDQVAKVESLLEDQQPLVRLRAAQGLLAARNKAAVPSFVSLLDSVPASYLPRIEETLHRIAQDQGPNESLTGDSRAKAIKAWKKWADDNAGKIDLASIGDRESFLGLVTICEYDNQFGNIQGQVSEGPRNGPKRWTFGGVNTQLMGPMDARALPNGRVLVAENSANRVTERDTKGNIKWEYRTPLNPICAQRLPNGNTFIASYNMVMEIKPDKSEVYRIQSTGQNPFHIFSAHKAKNGNIVLIGAQNNIVEMDAKGKRLHAVQHNTAGNWCSVELMPNGNYLVASMSTNSVKEINRNGGGEVWSKTFPPNSGVFRATRLPNGNILACCMNSKQVMEIERPSGNFRWQITTTGRPWAVHYR